MQEYTYQISRVKTLIDINRDTTNFKCQFTISSTDQQPFEMIITDQSTLDREEHLDFKHITDGTISGEIVADRNVYQNYFLVLRSSQPTSIHVSLSFEPLADYIPSKQTTGDKKSRRTSTTPAKQPRDLSVLRPYVVPCVFGMILLGSVYMIMKPDRPPRRGNVQGSMNQSLLDKLQKVPLD